MSLDQTLDVLQQYLVDSFPDQWTGAAVHVPVHSSLWCACLVPLGLVFGLFQETAGRQKGWTPWPWGENMCSQALRPWTSHLSTCPPPWEELPRSRIVLLTLEIRHFTFYIFLYFLLKPASDVFFFLPSPGKVESWRANRCLSFHVDF